MKAILYQRCRLTGLIPDTGSVDTSKMVEMALQERPKLIIAVLRLTPGDWDYAVDESIADSVGHLLMADI
jgi:glycine hydroxymethyltransferase